MGGARDDMEQTDAPAPVETSGHERTISTESATEQRNLRTGTTPWTACGTPPVATRALTASTKADLVVVGAGITGALVAEEASRRGLSVVVLDRRPPGHGSTAASTALLQFEIDTPFIHLADAIGGERARRAWLRSYRAVQDLGRLVRDHDISCDFRAREALYLSGNVLEAAELAEEGRQRRAIGLPSIYLDHAQLRSLAGIDRPAALLSRGAADVDPVRLTAGLLRRATARSCRIFSPTQLAEVAPSTRGVGMVSTDGIELEANALVFATGYELADGVPTVGHRRASTWAFATRPQPQVVWGSGELIWEASDPYLYIRTTADGRVLVGGEDEDIDDEEARDALLPAKTRALQQKAHLLFPQLDVSAEHAWAGTFGESESGLPSIGAVPGMASCYAVLGYGGNGITFGMVASQIIGSILANGADEDTELFAFGR